ncbi:hypothetical protein [Parachryseolinea silvisoli]|jgi:hypothetical protein|uniref:hypothetical protein n=1 Tax=Parachryseolinea silvisoli TaxID=2873601 RepID=UPI002265D907|nr:hypothetical protein [Parachryseolinea silvisoli]MCD9017084.1 hypothetical protein [Parachryseolinea silvisoli]
MAQLRQSSKKSIRKPKTVLGIPGKWDSREALIGAIHSTNQGTFELQNGILKNLRTGDTYEVVIQDRNDGLRESFATAALFDEYRRVDDEFLDIIDQHTHITYVVGETGSFTTAGAIAAAAIAILNGGGVGVKVESSGIAFTRSEWEHLVERLHPENQYADNNVDLMAMFVHPAVNDGKQTTYSRGMHNLGMKDVMVQGLEFEGGAELAIEFNTFQVLDKPEFPDEGFIFELQLENSEESAFDMYAIHDQPHSGDELFENPYGLWRLSPTDEEAYDEEEEEFDDEEDPDEEATR